MHPNPHADGDPEPALGLFVEPGHLAGDLQTRQHRPARIVLMCAGVTEDRQQPVALVRAEVALKAVHGRGAPVRGSGPPAFGRFRLHLRRQTGRIDQIGEKYCQSANLTRIGRRGQQILGLGVHAISGQHLLRQRRAGHSITSVDRGHRLIEQIIDRHGALRTGITDSRHAQRPLSLT